MNGHCPELLGNGAELDFDAGTNVRHCEPPPGLGPSLDDFFDRLKLVDDVVWTPFWQSEEATEYALATEKWFYENSAHGIFYRARDELPTPFADMVRLARPEVLYHPSTCAYAKALDPEDFDACGNRRIAPGDAFVWKRKRMTKSNASKTAFTAAMFCTSQTWQDGIRRDRPSAWKTDDGSAEFLEMHYRMATRRDFPRVGCFAFARVPLDPDSGALVEQWGHVRALVHFFEAHASDPTRTIATRVTQMPGPAVTWKATLGPMRSNPVLNLMQNLIKSAGFFEQVVDSADIQYVVVSVRRCVGGAPLLPSRDGGVDHESQSKHVDLPVYLREFLARLAVSDVTIYDSLDGHLLVPYQAVLQRLHWERAWRLIEEPFEELRRAYRQILKTRHSPRLVTDLEPRFIDEKRSDIEQGCGQDVRLTLPTRGTFVHFPKPMLHLKSRSTVDDTVMVRKATLLS